MMSGGGGSGTDRFSELPAASAAKDGVASGKSSDTPNLNMGVTEGGGTGATSAGQYGNDPYTPTKYKIPGLNAAKPASAAVARVPASTDVASDGGLSLFNISSRAIQNMCNSNRLKHCGRN
jgi:hypothetical protein